MTFSRVTLLGVGFLGLSFGELTVYLVVMQPTLREWSAMTSELSQHSSPLVPTLMCPERRSRLGEVQDVCFRSGSTHAHMLGACVNKSDVRCAMQRNMVSEGPASPHPGQCPPRPPGHNLGNVSTPCL